MTELSNLIQEEVSLITFNKLQQGHGVFEMPSAAGKTICTLSIILAFMKQANKKTKLVYCTKTLIEMDNIIEDLKLLPEEQNILALCLSSKSNLCIHKKVSEEPNRSQIDNLCRSKTAEWVQNKTNGNPKKT